MNVQKCVTQIIYLGPLPKRHYIIQHYPLEFLKSQCTAPFPALLHSPTDSPKHPPLVEGYAPSLGPEKQGNPKRRHWPFGPELCRRSRTQAPEKLAEVPAAPEPREQRNRRRSWGPLPGRGSEPNRPAQSRGVYSPRNGGGVLKIRNSTRFECLCRRRQLVSKDTPQRQRRGVTARPPGAGLILVPHPRA